MLAEVRATHRKPCTMCNRNSFDFGDHYIYDASQPFGTDKICMDCADVWLDEQEDAADEDEDEDEAGDEDGDEDEV